MGVMVTTQLITQGFHNFRIQKQVAMRPVHGLVRQEN